MLRAEVEHKEKAASTEMLNLLYDKMAREVSPAIERIGAIVDRRGGTAEERAASLRSIYVIGTYVKRRSNLIFLAAEHGDTIPAEELYYCLRESADALKPMGVDCTIRFDAEGLLAADEVKRAYDAFERSLEGFAAIQPGLDVKVEQRGAGLHIFINGEEVAQ